MKKLLAILLTMVMLLSLSVTAFAASEGFVSSPSTRPAPEVESFEPADEDCEASLVVTPYSQKEKLPETLETLLKNAREEVSSSEDLTELNEDLEDIAKSKNIRSKNLAVSDLFDIHVAGCDFHDGHKDFDIVLSADTLSHFVALLHMQKDGEWELVKDARVTNNGEHLEFSVESFSPFAIVVDTTESTVTAPQTGENNKVYLYVTIMVISALAVVLLFKKCKKANS